MHSVPRIVALISARPNPPTCHVGFHASSSPKHKPNHKSKQLSKYHALFLKKISKISMGEELSQLTKHANKIIISIFLNMKATIFDTHSKQVGKKLLF